VCWGGFNGRAGGLIGGGIWLCAGAAKDIKIKYDIDPREIGHGHYGIVRKAR
jgi:hypothetical protein